jgi:hypothetical protein
MVVLHALVLRVCGNLSIATLILAQLIARQRIGRMMAHALYLVVVV